VKTVDAGVLAVSYLEDGAPGGWPVILSHGFPYDVRAYDEVVPLLTAQGARVIRPCYFGTIRHHQRDIYALNDSSYPSIGLVAQPVCHL
jgi:pimeloyl-ACP methyl ester carboxylesterase